MSKYLEHNSKPRSHKGKDCVNTKTAHLKPAHRKTLH